jgi:hypothetical protein
MYRFKEKVIRKIPVSPQRNTDTPIQFGVRTACRRADAGITDARSCLPITLSEEIGHAWKRIWRRYTHKRAASATHLREERQL